MGLQAGNEDHVSADKAAAEKADGSLPTVAAAVGSSSSGSTAPLLTKDEAELGVMNTEEEEEEEEQ